MKLRTHGIFGLFLMPMEDALLWSFLGMVLGAILIWLWVRNCGMK